MGTFLIEFSYIHMVILILLTYLLFYLFVLRRSINLRCRVGKYCINGKVNGLFLDKYLSCIYIGIIRSISYVIIKIPMMEVYIRTYKKYINNKNKKYMIPADFISNKILLSAIFLLVINIIGSIDGNMVTDVEVIIFTLLGYVIPDVYYEIKYNRY